MIALHCMGVYFVDDASVSFESGFTGVYHSRAACRSLALSASSLSLIAFS